MEAGNNSKVTFHYTVTIEDGTVVDSTKEEEPLTVQLGEKQLLPDLEKELVGMKEGEEKSVELTPEQAFGEIQEDAITDIPRQNINLDENIQEGMYIDLTDENEQNFRGLVKELNDDNVKIDFNHPLAGRKLTFYVEVVEVN
ncbi:peptidylprolyl isomerase FKBP-type [Flexistipes sinusarabici DSM 4947]|uniref:Peptidyl-prolyl cis-trans isomerase n=2 Tax=Flexistipes sinusarabici TaxID=2352 RepID=F8E4Z6_FLESM|nr:peptidylprolyl isomerase [Flexistipes sinusarabici]AEI14566.1 peptidylprolyl isomerase FKBP-type [Flexistipes sinusarabici DSM 4947]